MKLFTEELTVKNSIVSKKIILKKNHFNQTGVFALKPIKKGEIVVIFTGVVISKSDMEILPQNLQKYPLQIDDNYFLGLKDKSQFDIAEYINHSCDPNTGIIGNNVLVALRNIKKNEEICFDYAMSEFSYSVIKWKCMCATKKCRKWIMADDWQDRILQKRYRNYFSYYIEKKLTINKQNSVLDIWKRFYILKKRTYVFYSPSYYCSSFP